MCKEEKEEEENVGVELDALDSRAIQANLLLRQYPRLKEQLCGGEVMLAISQRKPMRITGLFCILIGIVAAVQTLEFFLFQHPWWGAAALPFFVAVVWAGVWLAFLMGREYVFVTDSRIVHQRLDLLGRRKSSVVSILFSEIEGVNLYRSSILFRTFDNMDGDLLIRRKNGSSYIVMALQDSVNLSEILIAELRRYRTRPK
jgi:hypothetical protein